MKPTRPNTKLFHETASQTAGPYVHIGLTPHATGIALYDHEAGSRVAGPQTQGERIRVHGVVWDGQGDPVRDVLIEVWQPNAAGHFAGSDTAEADFQGWGRIVSDFDTGEWRLDTIKPGAPEGQAPHLHLWIVARGINTGLHTRMYFPDEPRNADDPVLTMIDVAEHRQTLIAAHLGDGAYRFDISLQGASETVFFDV
ncbi:MAG: protocatechuate 3,4-dioxygenase subunit alpha [Pseudomonadota bacterium]